MKNMLILVVMLTTTSITQITNSQPCEDGDKGLSACCQHDSGYVYSGLDRIKNLLIKYSDPNLPIVEPHIAVNPGNKNHMVIAAMVYDSALTSGIRTHIVVFTTKDNGMTWHQNDLPMTIGFDPWVAIRNDQEVILVALTNTDKSQRTRLGYFTSADGGINWSEAGNLGYGHDHPTLAIDRTNDRLYILSSAGKTNTSNGHRFGIYLNYTDDWKTFRDSAIYFFPEAPNSNTLTVAVHPDGNIIAPFLEFQVENNQPVRGKIKYLKWDDQKFSQPFLLSDSTGLGKGFPVLAIDTSSKNRGRMYLLRNSGTDTKRSEGIFLHHSLTGNEWSQGIRVDHNRNKEKYIRSAAMAINKDGIIGIAWYDRRNDSLLKKNDLYFSFSKDGGQTFSLEMRITETSSDPLTEKNGKAGLRHHAGGDYMGCVAKPDGSFQLVWADSRSGVYQLYTCNINVKM